MKCAIMQPTYIPWIGYFHMIHLVDVFVFLDDVQFSKRSWQQRNSIALNGKTRMLTIPVISKNLRNQKINEVRIDSQSDWQKQHFELIKYAYFKKPYFHDVEKMLIHYKQHPELLSNFTINFIIDLSKRLGINTKFLKSSELPVCGKKSSYLVEICKTIGADEYLSAAGSKEYIEEEGIFSKVPIKVDYHQSDPYIYQQKEENIFIPYLSIIDFIANKGFDNFQKEILNESNLSN